MRELRGRGLTADNLARLTIRISKKSAINIGWPYKPAEVITAQMNGQYAAAVTLLDGEAFTDQYAPARLADPNIVALLPKIAFVHDPEIDKGGAGKRHTVKVEAVKNDGATLTTVIEQRRGSADHPLSRDEVVAKFRKIAAVALSEAAVEETIALTEGIERERDLARFTAQIAAK
jgi:2-methylcitrate dehydratase PrpD